MRIGLLQAGRVNERIVEQFGEYPGMVETLLGFSGDELEFRNWRLLDGELPHSPRETDGWIISGSRHAVYDDLPWIPATRQFLRNSFDAGIPVVGICFGHQLLAEALGGRVEKSQRGWGIGVQSYEVLARPRWMSDASETVSFQSIHQDQIVELPPETEVIAGSEFCPYGMVAYGDFGFSVQAHPEFTREFSRALLEALRGDRIPRKTVDLALQTLELPTDAGNFSVWTKNFFACCRATRNPEL